MNEFLKSVLTQAVTEVISSMSTAELKEFIMAPYAELREDLALG